MASVSSDDVAYLPATTRRAVKIMIAGGFGVGKTTMVTTLSEIRPLRTEETMTRASEMVDDLRGLPNKDTTTVALDFGRITLNEQLVLYLFGAPGQQRFHPLWTHLAAGALGALVLADTRRLDNSFDTIDLLERMSIRYAVAINEFDGVPVPAEQELREALDLHPATPLVSCDARHRNSSVDALIDLVQYLFTDHQENS